MTATADELTKVFDYLAGLPRWVSWVAKASARPDKFDKVPSNGHRNLSTTNSDHWVQLTQAAMAGTDGVGIVFTDGIHHEGYTLLGFDVDQADKGFSFPFITYTETSPSGKGLRAFAWVPDEWVEPYQDSTNSHPPHCDHLEVYLGTAPRFLTVTFDTRDAKQIKRLTRDEFEGVIPWLKKKTPKLETTIAPSTSGKVLDLSLEPLTDKHRALLSGKDGIDRSQILYSLLTTLIAKGKAPEDILATMLDHSALWQYCLDHRSNNADKAVAFAKAEIERASRPLPAGLEMLQSVLKKKEEAPAAVVSSPDFLLVERHLTSELLHTSIPARDFVLKPHLPLGCLVEFSGAHGISKSTLALDMAACVATGRNWCGHKVMEGDVAFLSREDTFDDILRRLQAWLNATPRQIRNTVEAALCEHLTVLGREDTTGLILTVKAFGTCDISHEAVCAASEKLRGKKLIVMETASRLHGGDEINEHFNRFSDALELIASNTGACVMVIRHVSKSAARAKEIDSYIGRGGGSFSDAARSVLVMAQMEPEDLRTRGIALDGLADALNNPVMVLANPKNNYDVAADPVYFVRLPGPVLQQVLPRANEGFEKQMEAFIEERKAEGMHEMSNSSLERANVIPRRKTEFVMESLKRKGIVSCNYVDHKGRTAMIWKFLDRPVDLDSETVSHDDTQDSEDGI